MRSVDRLEPRLRRHIQTTCEAFYHSRKDSRQMSIPRSNSKASTFRSDTGNYKYIITTRRFTYNQELRHRNRFADLQGLGIVAVLRREMKPVHQGPLALAEAIGRLT